MNILFLMIPMALLLGLIFVAGFIWAVNNAQMDDLETPALRILNDDTKNIKILNKKIVKTNHNTERD
jgi:cbb3-type cytochrome oxidase maturation protein